MNEIEINAMIAALTEQRNEALNVVARLKVMLALRDARISELEQAAKSKDANPIPLEDHFD